MTGVIRMEDITYPITENDYIVKNSSGEFYPMSQHLFHKTYDNIKN